MITIKDSGDRTKFETGAVRDMHAGKGRMDLLPVTAIIELSKHCEAGALKYGERKTNNLHNLTLTFFQFHLMCEMTTIVTESDKSALLTVFPHCNPQC
mgnify:CR=1 FL=1